MIPIYKSEINDGLRDVIESNNSIAYACELKIKSEIPDSVQKSIGQFKTQADIQDFDLYYIDSILVSTGWNNNTDIFDPILTWNARNTPVHKQTNFMHNESQIIGHIISSFGMNRNGEMISDDTPIDDLPVDFDIVVGSVLYKSWTKDENKSLMNKIITGIELGEYFISMECLFRNFDYGFIDENGTKSVVARNKETAFLTKYLKAYGGPGVYKNRRIGRLLKDFTFSGKGIVDKPANPRSIIFHNTIPFNYKSTANLNEDKINMAENTNRTENDELKNTVVKLEAELAQTKNDLTTKVATAETAIAERDKAIAELASLKEQLEKFRTELESTKANLVTANNELATVKADKIKSDRISKLIANKLSHDDASKIVAKWTTLTDEQFDEIVKLHSSKHDDEDDEDDEVEASTALDKTETEDKTVPVVPMTKPDNQKAVASWLRNDILKTTAKLNKEEN